MSGALADRELLDAALRRLDPGHRAVVVLHYLLGMPLPEVAASLGIPLGTAKSRLHYALAAMRAVGPPSPTRPRRRPRRAGRMTDRIAASTASCPPPRGPVPGAVSRLSRRGPGRPRPVAAAAGLDLPGRWLPMADIAGRPAFAPRVPVANRGRGIPHRRAPVAAIAIYVGTRPTSSRRRSAWRGTG